MLSPIEWTVFGALTVTGLAAWDSLDRDVGKIKRIFRNCGLTVNETNHATGNKKLKEIALYRKEKQDWGTEYAFRHPLGLSFEQIESKFHNIQDGLNAKHKGGQRRIALDHDGMLKIKVYDHDLPLSFPYIPPQEKRWEVPIGKGLEGEIYHDFNKIPHMVIGGTTRYGKTVLLKGIICSLISQKPQEAEFEVFDLKGGLGFGPFEKAKQVNGVQANVADSMSRLQQVEKHMVDRMKHFREQGFENMDDVPSNLHRIFIIVDEAAGLAKKGYKGDEYKARQTCENILADISRMGGGLGFHLIYCTQYPRYDVLPAQIKQNCDAKISFRLQTQKASEVVLEEGGAEKLPYVKGRAIYRTDRMMEIQVPLIKNDDVLNILKPHWRDGNEQNRREKPTPRQDTLIIG